MYWGKYCGCTLFINAHCMTLEVHETNEETFCLTIHIIGQFVLILHTPRSPSIS